MSFSFGFSGDDIEEDPNDATTPSHAQTTTQEAGPAPLPAQTHDLGEMVCPMFTLSHYPFVSSSIYPIHPKTTSSREKHSVT
jgi:hypothetical protein